MKRLWLLMCAYYFVKMVQGWEFVEVRKCHKLNHAWMYNIYTIFFKQKQGGKKPIIFLLWHGCNLDNVAIVAFRSTMSSHDHVDFMVTRDGLFRLQSPRPFQCVSALPFVEAHQMKAFSPILSDLNSIIHQLTFWLTCQTDILKNIEFTVVSILCCLTTNSSKCQFY